MKKHIKRILAITLMLCLCGMPVFSVSAASNSKNEVMPYLNNAATVSTNMSINSSGKMTITYNVAGYSSLTTKIVITTYIEKRTLGLFWTRVDNGQTDDQWVDTIKDYKYNGVRNYNLSSSGTYRVTVAYKIYGSGGSADNVEQQIKDSY